MGGYIQLGPYYGHNITVLRHALADDKRKRGVFSVYVGAPVTSPILEVAIDPLSLYVLGFRKLGAATWWEFKPTGNLPDLKPSSRLAGGSANYQDLGLKAAIGKKITVSPNRLLTEFAYFNGNYVDTLAKRKMLLLIFLVSEALRFDSVKYACLEYVTNPTIYFSAPDHYERNPDELDGHNFTITKALADTVNAWSEHSKSKHFDIALPCLGDSG